MQRALLPFLIACGGGAQPASTTPAPARDHPEHAAAHAGHHGGGMHHRFDDAAAWSKVFDDPKRDEWQQPDRVIAALELTPGMTVADVGAGTGYFTMPLARAVPQGRVIATDVEKAMVDHIIDRALREGYANITATVTPPDDPQLPAAGVDRVLVVDVWHHLGDRVGFAKHLAASLRPGGRIAIVDFTLEATLGPPVQHRLAPEAIIADLAAAGLTAEVALTLPQQYVVIGRR